MRPPSLLCGCAAEKGGAKSSSELGLSLWIFGCTFSMAADELIAYIVEGILPVPAFCASTQNELLAGFEVSAFVGECVESRRRDGCPVWSWMRVYGYDEVKSGAGRFFNCRLKSQV
ncbi:MAG: hypothetical protein PHT86_02455 [Methanocorpusculum sp.]|nr:hypothetical protein [Methanocorpusculum sp.]